MLRMRGQAAFFRKAYLHGMPCGHPFHVQLEPSSQPNGGQVQRTDTKYCISRGETSANKKRAYSVLLCNIFVFLNSEARYRKLPYAIKYYGDTPLGYFFGRMLGERIAASPEFSDVDMIIPVPLYWSRKWKRGYNQAEVIARGIARSLPAEVRTDILSRRRHTKTQTRLSVEEKAANVKSAFRSVKKVPPDIRHILLVDDVFTTGATLNACWQALRLAVNGARVSIATLAMVSN